MGATTAAGGGWDYSDGPYGPANWGVNNSHCRQNNSQSPINIETSKVVYDKPWSLTFEFYDKIHPNTTFDISNNGHSLVIDVANLNSHVSGGSLVGKYRTHSFHFHWGKADKGLEHTVDGKQYAAELHIMNFHDKYHNLSVALSAHDGLPLHQKPGQKPSEAGKARQA